MTSDPQVPQEGKLVEHIGKIIEVRRLCCLQPGDVVNFNGSELTVRSMNGVVRFVRQNASTYEHKPSANSQEWVEIIKSNESKIYDNNRP